MGTLGAMRCRFCRQTAARLMFVALLQDGGAQTNNPADQCWARDFEGPHDFDPEPAPDEAA